MQLLAVLKLVHAAPCRTGIDPRCSLPICNRLMQLLDVLTLFHAGFAESNRLMQLLAVLNVLKLFHAGFAESNRLMQLLAVLKLFHAAPCRTGIDPSSSLPNCNR